MLRRLHAANNSKKHDLRRRLLRFPRFSSIEHFHLPELMIGHGDQAHLSQRRHRQPDRSAVGFGRFLAGM